MQRPSDVYLLNATPETFSEQEYLRSVAKDYCFSVAQLKAVLQTREGRIKATRTRLALFCIIYLRSSFVLQVGLNAGQFTVNDLNLLSWRTDQMWLRPRIEPKAERHIWAFPRETGKSSVIFKAIPVWLLAHKHARFIAAFSNSDDQAISRLSAIRNIFRDNKLIRNDYPELVQSARRGGVKEADKSTKYKASSGVTLEVHGAGASFLGLLEDDTRPDVILLDDLEPGGEHATALATEQRLRTVRETILGLSPFAIVLWAGTTTRFDSLVHQALTASDKSGWVYSENFQTYHGHPIVEEMHDGVIYKRSCWPSKWSVDFLEKEREVSPREFALNYDNMPMSQSDGAWWEPSLFVVSELSTVSNRIISIDANVGTKDKSDPAGVSVISFSHTDKKACIDSVAAVKLKATELKRYVERLIEEYPDVSYVLFETNQGGEQLMYATFGYDFQQIYGIRLKGIQIPPGANKLYRADILLTRYRKHQIVHAKDFPSYQKELLSMPYFAKSPNQTDCVGMGVEFLAKLGVGTGKLYVGTRPG